MFGCSEVLFAYNALWLFRVFWPFAGAAPLIADVRATLSNRQMKSLNSGVTRQITIHR